MTPKAQSQKAPIEADKRLPPLDLPDYDGMIAALEKRVDDAEKRLSRLEASLGTGGS